MKKGVETVIASIGILSGIIMVISFIVVIWIDNPHITVKVLGTSFLIFCICILSSKAFNEDS